MQKSKVKKWLKNSSVISINNGYITDSYVLIKMNDFIKKCFNEVYPKANDECVIIRNGNIEEGGFDLRQMIESVKRDDNIQKVDFTNLTFIFKDKYEVLIYKRDNKKIFVNRKFLDTFGLDYDGWHGVLPKEKHSKKMNGSMKIIKFDDNNDIKVMILGIRMGADSVIYRDIK